MYKSQVTSHVCCSRFKTLLRYDDYLFNFHQKNVYLCQFCLHSKRLNVIICFKNSTKYLKKRLNIKSCYHTEFHRIPSINVLLNPKGEIGATKCFNCFIPSPFIHSSMCQNSEFIGHYVNLKFFYILLIKYSIIYCSRV